MTTPSEGLLFDVATPRTPIERLLLLADQYVQHNDMLDRLLRAGPSSELDAHAGSAEQLAAATRAAIKAVADERLFHSHELSDAVVRLQQLAFLSSASADHGPHTARTLTALAPEAAMECAGTLAYEIRHRRGSTGNVPDYRLASAHRTALWEIGCGNVVATSSLGRQYVRYRSERKTAYVSPRPASAPWPPPSAARTAQGPPARHPRPPPRSQPPGPADRSSGVTPPDASARLGRTGTTTAHVGS
ncbi:hypothetical protein AB0D59_32295 [Streptomyces sp. NPDC048417]|uniref:hypothetical protein n=1 Tax=Streptomyces sp. NPDC048417 TaxID=3155387 RepID=UPI0034385FED